MSINKKLIKNIIIGVVAVAVLTGAYLWAGNWQPKGDDPLENTQNVISLFDIKTEDISEILFDIGGKSFTLQKHKEDENTLWKVIEYPGYEISQTKLRNIISTVSSLTAEREISEVTNLNISEFGLDSPLGTVTVSLADGKKEILTIGQRVSVDSSCYVMKQGDKKVYTISKYSADEILKDINAYRETHIATYDYETITRVSLSRGGSKVMDIIKEESPDQTFQTSYFRMVYPYNENADSDNFDALVEKFNSVDVIDFVSENSLDASKYGIDKGYTLVVEDGNAKHTLRMGNTDENGNVYAMYNDKQFIFTMSADFYNAVSGVEPFDYIERFVHIFKLTDVEEIVVKDNDGEIKLTANHNEDKEKTEYFVNGTKIGGDSFKKKYQAVIGMIIAKPVGNLQKGKEVVSVSFKLTNGSFETTRYYEYSDREYLVQKPNGKQYLVFKKDIDEMRENIRK